MLIYQKFLMILLVGLLSSQVVFADDNKQLESIRQSILAQENKLADQKKQRINLVNDLKSQETTIANLLTAIEKNDDLLKSLNKEITDLIKQISLLQKQQEQQQKVLANLLDSAFRLGRTTALDLVFAEKESARNERIITYYGYFNKAKEEQIAELEKTKTQLSEKKISLEDKKTAQQALQKKQQIARNGLEKNRQNRKQTITALEASMQLNQQKLADLRENEAELRNKIIQAEKANRQIAQEETKQAEHIIEQQKRYNYTPSSSERALMARVSGIGQPKKLINWPVSGLVAHRFGEALQGELYWKGMVINAKDGTPVKAIADGRVILASWLQGYGFIVALEHGKGDMSLYGYNQRMLVNVGDKVENGQTIALVGSTGGRGVPSLYFEIRRDGIALDPSAWLKTLSRS